MAQPADLHAGMEAVKTALAREYPTQWHRMMVEWTRQEISDRVWLMYSANYLFRTAGVRWALDPLTLRQRLPSAPQVDLDALVMLDYVVLSHRHADHLDLNLLTRLCDFPAQWIVPEFLLDFVRTIDRPRSRVIVARPMETLKLGGLSLTPFEGNHWEASPGYPGDRGGVPAMGYLAEFNGKRWLIPGDTRTYDINKLPAFGRVNGLMAHLWLGRSQVQKQQPALLEDFCHYCLAAQAKRVVITHLQEVGRRLEEFWDVQHFDMVKKQLLEMQPLLPVTSALAGDSFNL
jgi:L-ascorbate metabolism protein UlaG (beta-lactamase superfamily)